MVQGSRGTKGGTRTHEVPASKGPKDPRDRVQRTKGKTQGSKDLEGPRVQRSKGPRVKGSTGQGSRVQRAKGLGPKDQGSKDSRVQGSRWPKGPRLKGPRV